MKSIKVLPNEEEQRVLVIDDDDDFAASVSEIIQEQGIGVKTASSGEEAIKLTAAFKPQVVLLDIRLGNETGTNLIPELRSRHVSAVIMLTAYADLETVIQALHFGAYDYLRKPVYPAQLVHTLERCFERVTLECERDLAERALKESQERYRLAIAGANDGVWDWDCKTGKMYVSSRWREMVGRNLLPDVITRELADEVIHTEDLELVRGRVAAHFAGATAFYLSEHRIAMEHGREVWVIERGVVVRSADGEPVRMAGSLTDISERKKLEQQLLQTQKMQAIGALAGGIAHDFNNLLTGILGYASLLKLDLGPDSQYIQELDVIEKAAGRAKELTNKLLGFARQGAVHVTRVDIHKLIGEITSLMDRTFDKNIKVHCELLANRSIVFADASQIHQVLLNLTINARDAMIDSSNKELCIATDIVTSLPHSVRLTGEHTGSAAGSAVGRAVGGATGSTVGETKSRAYLRVAISDTGCGMGDEVLERVFEPFYTTKPAGVGVGMGLAVVYGIVSGHGGFLDVKSAIGLGSTFNLYLPIDSDDGQEAGISVSEKEKPLLYYGQGRILFVDDEDVLRSVGERMLSRLGYNVTTASSAKEALEIISANDVVFDVVILDMMMPGMTGKECAEELKKVNPSLPIVICSGYGVSADDSKNLENIAAVVKKPFSIAQLSEVVSYVINRKKVYR